MSDLAAPLRARAERAPATPFRERTGEALGDRFLQQALGIATTKFIELRREAFDGFAAMTAAARAASPEALVVLHGGPLADPATVAEALAYTGADGYATGSSAERTPVLAAVKGAVEAFRSLPVRPRGD